jgi:hypothetical protein
MPRRVVIAVTAALLPLLGGCEAGNSAPSLQWHRPADGTGKSYGGITVSNMFLLGAPLGAQLQPGQNAGLFFGLTNTGSTADHLTRVTALTNSGRALASSVSLPGGQVNLWSQHQVLLTGPAPKVILENLLQPVRGGSVVTICLTFAVAGKHCLRVPVMPMAQYYATLSPAPAAVPTAAPTRAPHVTARHHKHAGRRSPAPSPSP